MVSVLGYLERTEMIVVDYRTGSKDLLPFFSAYSVRAEAGTIEFGDPPKPAGDIMFVGNGPRGDVVVGIERKRITTGDMITSMRDERRAGAQLQVMMQAYDYSWLLVEGAIDSGPTGELMKLGGSGWIPVQN